MTSCYQVALDKMGLVNNFPLHLVIEPGTAGHKNLVCITVGENLNLIVIKTTMNWMDVKLLDTRRN